MHNNQPLLQFFATAWVDRLATSSSAITSGHTPLLAVRVSRELLRSSVEASCRSTMMKVVVLF